MRTGQLLSANCTTGWLDWTPGSLWLLSDGIFRCERDRSTIRSRHELRVDLACRPTREFANEELELLDENGSRTVWVPGNQITSATLRRGLTTDSAVLSLRDRSRVKLLWMRRDHAHRPLAEALARWGVPITIRGRSGQASS